MKTLVCSAWMLAAAVAPGYAAEDAEPNINNYLVDISAGTVSAVGLIGAKDAAITTIETSQDLVVALKPFASQGGGKGAFGLAITPARTTLFPMSGNTYASDWRSRLVGNLTFSYAQSDVDIAQKNYKKSAYAINTVYFFDLADDPVYQASMAFKSCADKTGADFARELQEILKKGGDTQAALEELTSKRQAKLSACMAPSLVTRWNAGRMSVSYGEGRISPAGAGSSSSLGRTLTVNAQAGIGAKGLMQLSVRQARNAVDLSTLGDATQAFKNSRLAALRVTYGDQEASSLRGLIEVSNAKSSRAGVFSDAFMHAVGIDKRIAKGLWLEFRLGRSRTVVDGKEQTTALMNLNISPTLFEFKK